MTAWARIEHPETGGTATVPRPSLGTYETAGWAEAPAGRPEPAPEPAPADVPGTSTPEPPAGGTETEEQIS